MHDDDEDAYARNLDQISAKIKRICSIVLLSVGIIGNIISVVIYLRKKFRNQSIGIYLAVLSIFNIFAVASLLNDMYSFEWSRTTAYCKYYAYLHYINLQYCSWILVINSMDHLLSIVMAIRLNNKIFKTKKFQFLVLFVCLLILFLINIPLFMHAYYNEKEKGCDLHAHVSYIIDIIDMFVCTLVPFIIMTVCTFIIISKVFKLKKPMNKRNRSSKNIFKKKTVFARTVIGINVLFLACNLPISIILIILNYNTYAQTLSSSKKAELKLVYTIFHLIMYVHNAIPFFVYLICNRLFRQEFLQLIHFHRFHELNRHISTRSTQYQRASEKDPHR